MRARIEPFGAWVRVDDGTLVAVTRAAARRIGLSGGALWSDDAEARRPRPPLEVHVAVTSRCGAGCAGCYVDARPDGETPPFAVIAERLRAVAEGGAFTVAFGGGEPLGRSDLGALAVEARRLGLTPVVTTSGIGMTRERAESLRSFAQVNVSYDGEGDDYRAVRGYDGAKIAERAMALLREAGVPFGVNVVLTRSTLERLARTAARAEALGAREVQLLRYKPAGRAESVAYLAARLSPAQIDALFPTLMRIAAERTVALRIDCALLPLLSAHPIDPAVLARFGVFGCEAGRHLAAVRIDGAIAPCSFGPGAGVAALAALGRRGDEEEGEDGWAHDATLEAWRAAPDVEPCRSCSIREACRGGCRVVAAHLAGAVGPSHDGAASGPIPRAPVGPDPECPRVRAHRHARGASAAPQG